jgi:hypothetical protein
MYSFSTFITGEATSWRYIQYGWIDKFVFVLLDACRKSDPRLPYRIVVVLLSHAELRPSKPLTIRAAAAKRMRVSGAIARKRV